MTCNDFLHLLESLTMHTKPVKAKGRNMLHTQKTYRRVYSHMVVLNSNLWNAGCQA